jgi:transcriptional regulator with XRE-family HTH domain
MAPTTYADVLARNIRAARSRADIGQESLAARMRALGHDAWIRQTVGSTERGRRRPTAEEVLGLSVALETSISALMAPADEDKVVDFPSGATVSVGFVYRSARGFNDGAVQWDGDVPVFSHPDGPAPRPPWPPEGSAALGLTAATARRIADLEDQLAERQERG